MEKLKKRTSKVVAEEDHLRMEGKTETDEEDGTIRDEFAVLCRDLYALYPLLIRYIDNNRYNSVTNTSTFLFTFLSFSSIFVQNQGKVVDVPRPSRRGAVPNGWRSLYFLVQIPRECVCVFLSAFECPCPY